MKKIFCFMIAALLTLTLPICGRAEALEGTTTKPVTCVFNSALFDGKIKDCAYAGDGKLFVAADKLYLYDTTTASVLATTETPLRYFEAQTIDGGYVLSGMGNSGMMVYVYDSALALTKKIAVNEILPEDFVISETGVAASADGKKLAITAMNGLYLYDLEKEKLTTLLDLTKKAGTSTIHISMLNGLAFTHDNSRITFYGGGLSIPAKKGESSFSKLITRKEAAKILGISIATLDAARNNGQISYVQYVENGCVYFTDSGLQEYIAKYTHKAKPVEKSSTYRTPRKPNSGKSHL